MNQFIKKLGFACLLSFLLLGLLACSAQENPYQDNDNAGYNVSVRFDANGGSFTTKTYIITDSFSLSGLKTNSSGMVELPLLSPDDARRGSDAFSPVRTGYFLAGLADGMPIADVLKMSAKASSIAVTRAGAVPSIPYRDEVMAALTE